MQTVALVEQREPYALYRPPAERVQSGPRQGPPLVPPFRQGVADTGLMAFGAGLLVGMFLG